MWCTCSGWTSASISRVQRSHLSPHPQAPIHTHTITAVIALTVYTCTSFFAPKLLASMEAAERGSRRAADRGSDAAEIERGSCRGSVVGGAAEVPFELLPPFPFLAEVASTDCGKTNAGTPAYYKHPREGARTN